MGKHFDTDTVDLGGGRREGNRESVAAFDLVLEAIGLGDLAEKRSVGYWSMAALSSALAWLLVFAVAYIALDPWRAVLLATLAIPAGCAGAYVARRIPDALADLRAWRAARKTSFKPPVAHKPLSIKHKKPEPVRLNC